MRELRGCPVSKGIAYEKTYIYKSFSGFVPEEKFVGDEKPHLDKLNKSYKMAHNELSLLIEELAKYDEDKAKIFIAHCEILGDEEIVQSIKHEIKNNKYIPAYAVWKAYEEFIQLLSGVDDLLISERCADLIDVRNRLIRKILGIKESTLSSLSEDVIIIAHDLLPSDTVSLDRLHVKGIITEVGGSTSHSAIIAKSYQIPAVLGVSNITSIATDDDLIAMDAVDGVIILNPNDSQLHEIKNKKEEFEKMSAITKEYIDKAPLTADGTRIDIGINIGSDEVSDYSNLYDFVGLFRTEFLYMNSNHLPSEEEQFNAYKKVVEDAKGKPVTLRTLDIGGDKTLQYYDLPKEMNPFLGKRALRLCFDDVEIFLTQLRAALRASKFGMLNIMFPMVGSIDDIRRAKQLVKKAKDQLKQKNIDFDPNIKLGIMIEIPSIALIADKAAKEVDFASIGTNDLCQYTCAVDRMNPGVSQYYQSLSPAMIKIIDMAVSAFNDAGKLISICGEMGGDPYSAVLLVGLGVRKLSMSFANIAGVKQSLSKVTMIEAESIAKTSRQMDTEESVKGYLNALFTRKNL